MDEVETIRSRELARAEPRVFQTIAVVAAAQMIVAAVLLDAVDFPRWRLAAAALLGIGTVLLARLEMKGPRPRSRWLQGAIPVSSVVLFGGMLAAVEGPSSPLSPLLFHVVVGQAGRNGFTRTSWLCLATSLVVLALMLVLPDPWFGPDLPETHRDGLWAVMLGGVLITQFVESSAARRAYDAAAAQLDGMREAILRDHAARARGLETIGAKVAHELKNPLTSIKALLQMMGDDAEGDDDRQRFEVLDGEVARMQTILQDYLSFSRPLDELRTTDVDLAALARHVAAVMEARAADAGVELIVSGPSLTIVGDEERLRGMLLNLVGNALEATPEGGTVGIAIQSDGEGARITVRDTGRGMSPRQLEKLGTPFVSTKKKGTGLGVVIASATARQHGGTIRFDSTEGKGTTVIVDLPAAADPGGDPSASYDKLSHLDVAKLVPPPKTAPD